MLVGDDGLARMRNACVMVVGCGAVGSFAIEALTRAGIGHMVVMDFDTVAASNINRQLFALDSTIGRPKVDVARDRIFDINPRTCVTALNRRFDDNTNLDIAPDYVIDAIDDATGKLALYRWCAARNIPLVSSMGAARKSDLTQIKIAPLSKTSVCPLAARMRRMVRGENLPDFPVVFSTETPSAVVLPGRVFGSLVTVTGTFGLYLANYVINQIIA